jgi:large subunit ribosomal protein L6
MVQVKAFLLDQSTFCLYGIDKNQVTQVASNIRRIRPPEPYKGAGIRIVGENVRIKERKIK